MPELYEKLHEEHEAWQKNKLQVKRMWPGIMDKRFVVEGKDCYFPARGSLSFRAGLSNWCRMRTEIANQVNRQMFDSHRLDPHPKLHRTTLCATGPRNHDVGHLVKTRSICTGRKGCAATVPIPAALSGLRTGTQTAAAHRRSHDVAS